ncbi:hypothetical protein [Rhodoplanes roseus]|uniref:hypothetical protein n=1 Tax=Rhodoplanes roseus TaxID=29409 RepID=UPI001474588A|nr:hypothetical protein [Rhodoplanes roseus]
MTPIAMNDNADPTPTGILLILAILLVTIMPMVAAGASSLGSWLARMGFSFAGL